MGARLKFWRRSRVPKTRIRDAYFSRLRRQISLDYYTIPPATQASVKRPKIEEISPLAVNRVKRVNLKKAFVSYLDLLN